MGETLDVARISVEGRGMLLVNGVGVAHFLVEDGKSAQAALEQAGMVVAECRKVVVPRLSQDEPGQLGKFCLALADADINIEVLHSDHDHQPIVAVDNREAATTISQTWMSARPA